MSTLEQHEQRYKETARDHQLSSGTLMIHEAHELEKKFKEVSYAYMGVLLSHGEARFIFKDQYFFETMIYFLSQIMKENFEEDIYPVIDSELNRIFRTNTFNLIKRRYQEDKLMDEYPELKDTKYSSTAQGDSELISRLKAHKKFHYSMQIRNKPEPSLTKPLDIQNSASHSIHSRSPLIASYFPSSR
jgi:protein phosphatase 1 regulatory subunit 36